MAVGELCFVSLPVFHVLNITLSYKFCSRCERMVQGSLVIGFLALNKIDLNKFK